MEKNLQKVSFKLANQWYDSVIDLKSVYTSVHAGAKNYGSSANQLVSEMFANLLELAFQKKIDLTNTLLITDYGCGQSKASNVLAEVLANNAEKIASLMEKGVGINEILQDLSQEIKNADSAEVTEIIPRVTKYRHIIVQRYDIGIPEYSIKPVNKADVVFCNDVLEHIPEHELPDFLTGLQEAGKYIFASISLRDAVNYMAIPESMLWENAQKVDAPSGIVLTKDVSGAYIFSLHVSVLPQSKWQEILGSQWTLLPAQDYTAVSAMNFAPSAKYQAEKRDLIAQVGFADFIPFPTKMGTRYEQDPILWRRTALMQPQKHIQKLNALEGHPESAFKAKEKQESLEFLSYIGAKISQKEDGSWELEDMPEFLDKLAELEKLSKAGNKTDEAVKAAATKIIRQGL